MSDGLVLDPEACRENDAASHDVSYRGDALGEIEIAVGIR
jgi:hypothetical protein